MFRLLTSLLVASLALASPPPSRPKPKQPDCIEKSRNTKHLTIKNFDFHAMYLFTTPAHQNSWGYINFTLVNPNLPYTVECSAASDRVNDFFYGDTVYSCSEPKFKRPATFTFSKATGELKINQTWPCPKGPVTLGVEATAKVKLSCKECPWKNTRWTAGQIYSTKAVTCKPANAIAPIQSWFAVA